MIPCWYKNISFKKIYTVALSKVLLRWLSSLSITFSDMCIQVVSSVPLQGCVSKTWCGQLPWFSMTWMITALERAWRPVVSKLRPSRQVSWQELQDDHTVKWQSPEGKRRPKKHLTDRHNFVNNAGRLSFQIFEGGLCSACQHYFRDHFIGSPASSWNI